jgi:hypothetical protein
MNVRKACTLVLAVFTSLIILSGYSTVHHWSGSQLIGTPHQSQVSDGGSPAPPYPPVLGTLTADGGSPAPPYPPTPATLTADGGSPAPPYPPTPATLTADGGSPAPPYPPKLSNAAFFLAA